MEEKVFLEKYNSDQYWKPSMAADALVFNICHESANSSLKLLLIKRRNHPYQGYWSLPGGFLEEGETLLEAAKRELEEETGVTDVSLEQLSIWDEPDRDKRTRIITMAYLAIADVRNDDIVAADDASEALLFDVEYKYELNVLSYTLKSAGLALNAKLSIDPKEDISKRFLILEANGIAFDHPKLIAHGLERIAEKNLISKS